MGIEIHENFHVDNKWNDFLRKSPLGNVYQTKEYAKYITTKGESPVFLSFVNSTGEIVGQILISFISRFEKKGKLKNIIKNIPGTKKETCKWIYGPIISDNKFKEEIYDNLQKYLIKKNCRISGSVHPLSQQQKIGNSKIEKKTWGTFLIDLSKSKAILWDNLEKHSARKNVERSKRKKIVIKEMTERDLIDYHRLLNETKQQQDVNISLDEVINEWNILKPTGFSGFLSYFENEPIAGLIFSSFNNYINEWGVARTEKDTKMKLYSQDHIKWKIIEWGNKNGCKYYDLSGVNPSPNTDKEKSIFRYKKKWGGKLTEYSTYRL